MSEAVDWKNWHSRNKDKREKMATKNKSSGSGGPPTWALRMKYFKVTPGTEVWLHFQQYKSSVFYEFYSRFVEVYDENGNARKRHVFSNAHNGERPVPCLLWFYCVEDENSNMFANQQYAMSVLVMDDFHKVARTSKAGKRYHDLVQCGGKDRFGRPTCELCDSGIETTFADQKYWSMWASHKRDFEAQLDRVPARCDSCKTGELSVFGFECSECKEVLANQYDGPITEADEDRLLNEDVACPKCEHTGRASKLIECARQVGEDKWERGCENPKAIDFGEGGFDVTNFDFRVKFEKVGNSTKALIVDMRPHDKETIREDIQYPLDMDLFLGQMELADQAKMLNRPNPFPPEAQKALADYFIAKSDEPDSQSVPWSE